MLEGAFTPGSKTKALEIEGHVGIDGIPKSRLETSAVGRLSLHSSAVRSGCVESADTSFARMIPHLGNRCGFEELCIEPGRMCATRRPSLQEILEPDLCGRPVVHGKGVVHRVANEAISHHGVAAQDSVADST